MRNTYTAYVKSLDDVKLQERLDKYKFIVADLKKKFLPENPQRSSAEDLLAALEEEVIERTLLGDSDDQHE